MISQNACKEFARACSLLVDAVQRGDNVDAAYQVAVRALSPTAEDRGRGFLEFWEELNRELATRGVADATYGPARNAFQAGKSVKEAADLLSPPPRKFEVSGIVHIAEGFDVTIDARTADEAATVVHKMMKDRYADNSSVQEIALQCVQERAS